MSKPNVFTVHSRLTSLENEVKALHAEIKAQSTFQQGQLHNWLSDKAREIAAGAKGEKGDRGPASTVAGPVGPKGDSVVGPRGRDSVTPGPQGAVGKTGARGERGADSFVPGPPGRDGKDSVVPGPPGIQGPPGDVTVCGPAELQAAVAILKAKLAKAQAAFLVGLERAQAAPHFSQFLKLNIERLKREAGL